MNTLTNKELIMIEDVWFENNRIYIKKTDGSVLSRPLEAFPILLDSSEKQRMAFEISSRGDSIRWTEIDEDIHISSFDKVEEPNRDNEIGNLFRQFPWLNVSEVARYIGINKSLLARYIYGIKTPSPMRAEQIKQAMRQMGSQLLSI